MGLTTLREHHASFFDQACGVLHIGNRQGMGHRLYEETVLLVPLAGVEVEVRNTCGPKLPQPTAQHLGKQVVVAIPLPPVIERDEEQIGPLHILQQCLTIITSAQSIIQRPAEAIKQAGLQEKALYFLRLT